MTFLVSPVSRVLSSPAAASATHQTKASFISTKNWIRECRLQVEENFFITEYKAGNRNVFRLLFMNLETKGWAVDYQTAEFLHISRGDCCYSNKEYFHTSSEGIFHDIRTMR